MKKTVLLLVLCLSLLSASAMAAAHERPMLVRVDLTTPGSFEILRDARIDIEYFAPGRYAEIVADDADFARLEELNLKPEIIHADLAAFYQSRFPVGTTMGGFKTLTEAIAYMDSLHTLYPSITTARDSIGYSYQGRPLWAMKISDNPETDEDEPEMFVNGLIHAREPMGQEATLRFMNYLCQNYGVDSLVTSLVDNREFYFIPVVNPDGYEYNRQTNPGGGGMWRKNRHGQGVDLNRNWGYMWGYDDIGSSPYPGDETYRGAGPFSEPETESMRRYINSRNFTVSMNFHTYAGLMLYPWGYADIYAPDEPLFLIIGDTCTAQSGYGYGTAWETLYNTNGESNDWQYGEQIEKPKIFSFTIEIGENFDGFWPDPSRIPTLWEHVRPALLYLASIADNPYAIDAPSAPHLLPIGNVNGNFTVRWNFYDTLNAAQAYELKELAGLQRITDTFESGTDNWDLDGFSRRSTRRHQGTYSLFSGSQDNYNGSAFLANPVTAAANDTLKFWAWYNIEQDYDYAYVQLSTDGGASYINLPGNITTNSNPYGLNQGNGITGASSNWVLAKFPMNSYAGQSVMLGIRYRTDGGVSYDGLYADEFYPVETFSTQNILSSDIPDTFFVVTGRTEGEYYYQARARDAQGQWSGFSNREIAVVQPGGGGCVYISGDANASGVFNGIDVVYSVNYLKGTGAAPPDTCDCPPNGVIYAAADANGNCAFNGIDVTFSVNYLKGQGIGPSPCPDCPPLVAVGARGKAQY